MIVEKGLLEIVEEAFEGVLLFLFIKVVVPRTLVSALPLVLQIQHIIQIGIDLHLFAIKICLIIIVVDF